MSESDLERALHRRGQELMRKLLQGHLDQRSPGEAAGPVEGTLSSAHSGTRGYLLVARGATLWKVPLDAPEAAAGITLPEEAPGQDGMVWTAGRLAIVSNSSNRGVALTSDDDWATASAAGVAGYEGQATTAAVVGGDVYVVHPHFADGDPPSFERVVFE